MFFDWNYLYDCQNSSIISTELLKFCCNLFIFHTKISFVHILFLSIESLYTFIQTDTYGIAVDETLCIFHVCIVLISLFQIA